MSDLLSEQISLRKKHKLFNDLLRALSMALDLKGGEQLSHAWRVAVIAHGIAKVMHHPHPNHLYYAGLLHDIGGIGLNSHILHYVSPEGVDPIVYEHPVKGENLLKSFVPFKPLLNIIRYHHEHFDGTGFPFGLKGKDIPVESSIILAADLLDIYFRDQQYEDFNYFAEDLLRKMSGKELFPQVAKAAVHLIHENKSFLNRVFNNTELKKIIYSLHLAPLEIQGSYVELLSQILWLFARITDSQRQHTMGHSIRTTFYALRIAEKYYNNSFNKWDIIWSGLLHDLGEIAIPNYILDKPSELTALEWDVVKKHTVYTMDILFTVSGMEHLAYPASANHEWFNGSGYPYGTSGEDIPLIGRFLALADAFDAMRSERPYRRKLSLEEALENISILSGEQFDPNLVEIAMPVFKKYDSKVKQLSDNMEDFKLLFKKDIVDIKTVFTATGTEPTELVSSSGGVLLLDLETWNLAETDKYMNIIYGKNNIEKVTGYKTDNFLYQLDFSSKQMISAHLKYMKTNDILTKYVFTLKHTPVELILLKEKENFRLLLRSAKNKLSSFESISHFYRNFMSSAEAVVFTDLQGKITDVNRKFLDLYELKIKDIIGKNINILKSGYNDDKIYEELWKNITDPAIGAWDGELINITSSGKKIYVHLSVKAIKDATGRRIGYIGNSIDITDRKKAEKALEESRRKLQEQNKKLKNLNELKTDMVAITSHDLKSPINTILTITGFIKENFDIMEPEQIKYYINQIENKGRSSIKFISDMLNLAKIEAGTYEFNPVLIELNDFIKNVLDEYLYLAEQKSLTLTMHDTSEQILIHADSPKLKQVIANIVGNAVKFTNEGGIITVKTELTEEGTVKIIIEDDGPGIKEEDLDIIFEKYGQSRKSGEKRSFGSGLGLYIAKNIIDIHHGKLSVENIRPHGARFIIDLPLFSKNQGIIKSPPGIILFGMDECMKNGVVSYLNRRSVQWIAVNKISSLKKLLKNSDGKTLFFSSTNEKLTEIASLINSGEYVNTRLVVIFDKNEFRDDACSVLSDTDYDSLTCPILGTELDLYIA